LDITLFFFVWPQSLSDYMCQMIPTFYYTKHPDKPILGVPRFDNNHYHFM